MYIKAIHIYVRNIDMKRVDCISLKLGINIHNLGSMAIQAFQQAAVGFISTIRDL